MTKPIVLVVGAGLAGLSAATALAEAGISVLVVDQAPAPGGNIHRQPTAGATPIKRTREHTSQWRRVIGRFEAGRDLIELRCNAQFSGIDHTGVALIADCSGENAAMIRPSALIIATGATERVQPRPGWTLPGVMTAGAIQTAMKTSGEAPVGRVVLAGSGPLLLAVGAQLTKLGAPPAAIIEAGRPFRHILQALHLPKEYLAEGLGYLRCLIAARVPILTGAQVASIARDTSTNQLHVSVETSAGRIKTLLADRVGLHDGLRPNDYGIGKINDLIVHKTGDGREILGARAAELDGMNIGAEVAARLTGRMPQPERTRAIDLHRRAQAVLGTIYANNSKTRLKDLPDDTVLCRCENKTVGDLHILNTPTLREVRLNGRFAMGSCQGRFCAEWVVHLIAPELNGADDLLTGNRWPVRPVSVKALIDAEDIAPPSKNIQGLPTQ